MSNLPLLSRPTITLRDFLTEMEAAIARNPWLADASLRIPGARYDVSTGMGAAPTQDDPQPVTSVSSGCTASTHFILLK